MQCDLKILKIQAKRLTKRMGDLKWALTIKGKKI
jgi:hypothetical protein